MTTTTSSFTGAWLPDHVDQLVVQPAMAAAIAAQVSTVVQPGERHNAFYVPVVTDDPEAAWTAEGSPITPSDATVDQVGGTYKKVAALTKVTNEAARDTSPAILEVTGAGMVRDIARQIDAAFFGSNLGNPLQPAGLEDVEDVSEVYAASYADLDPFAEAIAVAEGVGARLTSFVTDPTTALTLATLKDEDTSRRPLLGPDPTNPTRRQILGVPLYVSPYVSEGVVWGIPRDRTFLAWRQGTEVATSPHAGFDSDLTTIRAVARVTFAFAHPDALVRISDDIVSS